MKQRLRKEKDGEKREKKFTQSPLYFPVKKVKKLKKNYPTSEYYLSGFRNGYLKMTSQFVMGSRGRFEMGFNGSRRRVDC